MFRSFLLSLSGAALLTVPTVGYGGWTKYISGDNKIPKGDCLEMICSNGCVENDAGEGHCCGNGTLGSNCYGNQCCENGLKCDEKTQKCTNAGCTTDTDCLIEGQICTDGTCSCPSDVPQYTTWDGIQKCCVSPLPGVGQACTKWCDCADDLSCNLTKHVCEKVGCFYNNNCKKAGQFCLANDSFYEETCTKEYVGKHVLQKCTKKMQSVPGGCKNINTVTAISVTTDNRSFLIGKEKMSWLAAKNWCEAYNKKLVDPRNFNWPNEPQLDWEKLLITNVNRYWTAKMTNGSTKKYRVYLTLSKSTGYHWKKLEEHPVKTFKGNADVKAYPLCE